MSNQIDNITQIEYADYLESQYQANAQLRDTCKVKYGVRGSTFEWPQSGTATAVERGAPGSQLPTQEIDYSRPITTFKEYTANHSVDKGQLLQTSPDLNILSEAAEEIGYGMGRREDQVKIDALAASATTNVIAIAGAGLTLAKFIKLNQFFSENNIPRQDRYILIGPAQEADLLSLDKVTSTDYALEKNLATGYVNSFMHIKVFVQGGTDCAGLPLTVVAGVSTRKCLAWHRRALGCAYVQTPTSAVDWIPKDNSWFCSSIMQLGATALLPAGIVEINCIES